MAAGIRVGAYRIVRLINRGGQGSVYLGYDQRLHRRVAIKILQFPPGRSARSRLLREAQLIASIQSARVVQIHDVIESSGHLALVMEYVPGCDLSELLASVNPSLASILAIATDVTAALAAARQRGILHGDLKPSNILISAAGRVKLTDFGISRQPGVEGQSSAGSMSALSPEQYKGETLDIRSDLFSLGCLLYRLIAGVQPFFRGGRLDPELLLGQDPDPPTEIAADGSETPPELVAMVMSLLQKRPQDRPVNTHEVRGVLRAASRELPLADARRLLDESRDHFRPESEDDIPLQIPGDLTREGRSRMTGARAGIAGLARRFVQLRWPAALAVLVTAAALLVASWLLVRPAAEVVLHIEVLELDIAGDVEPPDEISELWMVEQVQQVAREQLGELRVIGPVGATPVTTLYPGDSVEGGAPPAQERIEIGLRCVQALCVVGLQRMARGGKVPSREQVLLFPDAGIEQWRDSFHTAVRALYH